MNIIPVKSLLGMASRYTVVGSEPSERARAMYAESKDYPPVITSAVVDARTDVIIRAHNGRPIPRPLLAAFIVALLVSSEHAYLSYATRGEPTADCISSREIVVRVLWRVRAYHRTLQGVAV